MTSISHPEPEMSKMPLEIADQQHLERAQGYAALGMFREANEELEEITPEIRHLPIILMVRTTIYRGTGRWEAMATVAGKLSEWDPAEPGWWIDYAYATRRAQSIDLAYAILCRAEKLHPDNGYIQFNLACYEAQLGQLPAAKRRVARAITIDPKFRHLAFEDPDLEPVWDDI